MTDSHRQFDAVIIGGGPAGATLALALARMCWNVAVVDKAVFPRIKVCGEFMSATSLSVIDALGLGPAWRERAGPPVKRLALFAGEYVVEAPAPGGALGLGRALGRDVLDTMLLAAAAGAGATVLQPCRATEVRRVAAGHEVRVVQGGETTTLRAAVLVAAHGSWEQGPLPTQLPTRHAATDFLGFKAYFAGAAMPPDLMPLLAFPGGYGGIAWADNGRLSLSCCIRRDVLAAARAARGDASAGAAVAAHLATHCRGVREVLAPAAQLGAWHAAGPLRPGTRPAYADGIFRVGNVAGESHPIIAEGISMALQSSWLLARELGRADTSDVTGRDLAGRRYTAAWRKQFSGRIRAASAFAQLASKPRGAAIGRAVIGRAPMLLTLGAKLAGKTAALPA